MTMSPIERAAIGLLAAALIAAACFYVRRSRERFHALIAGTLVLTFVLVVLGAYVRLSDAGLGCPDWPGCYGDLTPHHATEQIRAEERTRPQGPVTLEKAWKEMIHRYVAMVVGSLIAAIALLAWVNRRRFASSPGLATSLVGLVGFQALLGAWTVTMLLKPAIVTAHLLGGMAILALLAWLRLKQEAASPGGIIARSGLRAFAAVAFAALIAQIALGGWVSTNYAALACPDFPLCRGEWAPAMNFVDAFHVRRELGMSAEGQFLPIEALTAIHWMHRLGAGVAAVVLSVLGVWLARTPGAGRLGIALLGLLVLQLALGVANVLGSLPLAVAVAHNGVAALLATWMVQVNFRLNTGLD
jgi:heme a synthase